MAPDEDAGVEDARLVARCRSGDGAAWRELVQRYQRLVYAIVTRMGLDEHAAADVFQTVFDRLIEHLPRLAQPERLRAWIVTTARREALRERQRRGRHVSLTREEGDDGASLEDTLADEGPRADELLSELQHLDLLRSSVDRLDARCRELLLLVFGDDDEQPAYDEIGRRLNMPVGSIGPTRARCVAKLRRLFDAAAARGT